MVMVWIWLWRSNEPHLVPTINTFGHLTDKHFNLLKFTLLVNSHMVSTMEIEVRHNLEN